MLAKGRGRGRESCRGPAELVCKSKLLETLGRACWILNHSACASLRMGECFVERQDWLAAGIGIAHRVNPLGLSARFEDLAQLAEQRLAAFALLELPGYQVFAADAAAEAGPEFRLERP